MGRDQQVHSSHGGAVSRQSGFPKDHLMCFSFPKFGPRYIKLPNLDTGFGGDSFAEGHRELRGIPEFNAPRGGTGVLSPSPASLPTPVTNAEELAGGLTLNQLDQAARMEVEE